MITSRPGGLASTSTAQDMYVWLKLIFAKSETFRDIKIIISPFVHILKICIFTKFGGSSSKNKPAAPLRSLKWFWREIHFECSKDLQIWQKVGFSWDLKVVKFWLWYLKPILNNPRLTDILVPRCPQTGKKYSFHGFPAKTILNFSRAWQAYFLNYYLQIWWKGTSLEYVQMAK